MEEDDEEEEFAVVGDKANETDKASFADLRVGLISYEPGPGKKTNERKYIKPITNNKQILNFKSEILNKNF